MLRMNQLTITSVDHWELAFNRLDEKDIPSPRQLLSPRYNWYWDRHRAACKGFRQKVGDVFIIIGNKQKNRLSEFTIKKNGINGVLIALLFLFGLFLSWKLSAFAMLLYWVLWATSNFIRYVMTCRNYPDYCNAHCPLNPDFSMRLAVLFQWFVSQPARHR